MGRHSHPDAIGDLLLYQTEDGHTRIECRLQDETLWLSQAQLAELFQSTTQNIAKHLKAIFTVGELATDSVVNSRLTTAPDGKQYKVLHYRIEAILAVGYRVRSSRGTAFRQWATAQLREYLVKGFVMDDARLKQSGGSVYFDELLARIRDIRSSEKMFRGKVLDISRPGAMQRQLASTATLNRRSNACRSLRALLRKSSGSARLAAPSRTDSGRAVSHLSLNAYGFQLIRIGEILFFRVATRLYDCADRRARQFPIDSAVQDWDDLALPSRRGMRFPGAT